MQRAFKTLFRHFHFIWFNVEGRCIDDAGVSKCQKRWCTNKTSFDHCHHLHAFCSPFLPKANCILSTAQSEAGCIDISHCCASDHSLGGKYVFPLTMHSIFRPKRRKGQIAISSGL